MPQNPQDPQEKDKRSGLQKKVSSIFRGMPEIDNSSSIPDKVKKAVPPPLKEPVSITFSKPANIGPKPAASATPPSPETPSPAPEPKEPTPDKAVQATTDFMNQIRAAGRAIATSRLYVRSGIKPGDPSIRAGLDLGVHGYKWICLDKKRGLHSIAFHQWKDVDEATSEDARQAILKDLVSRTHSTNAKTSLSLRGDAISYQVLPLPVLSRAEMLKAVRWELTKKGMIESKEALVDYAVIDKKTEGGRALVLAVVAKEPFVTDTIRAAEEAGLIVQEVQTAVQALQQIVTQGSLFSHDQDGAILEMGYASSTLCFFKGSDLKYARVFGIGGRDFHSTITGALISDQGTIDISAEDAQTMIKVVGIPSDEMLRTNPAKTFLYQVTSRIRPILEDLVGELRRSLEYYVSSSGLGPVETLALSGGMGGIKGLPEYLSKEMGFPVKVLQPFDVLGIEYPPVFSKTTSQSTFSVALGLALEGGHRMALMPVKYQERRLDRTVMRWASLATAASLCGLLVLGAGLKIAQWGMKTQIGKVEQQLAGCVQPAKVCREVIAMSNRVAQREKEIIGFASRQPLWEGVLKEISHSIPSNVLLRELSVIPGSLPKTLTLVGTIFADNLSVDSQLSVFMERMASSPYFSSFDLVNRKNIPNADRPASAFEVRGVLHY